MTSAVEGQGASTSPYRVVGTRPIRHDGLEKVTGAAKYGADTQLAGTLYGKMVRSPHAHARIRHIDTTKAEALPGVAAVTTSRDFPLIDARPIDFGQMLGNARLVAEHVMARDKALFKGHAVAAVAAVNTHVAEQAARLIEVDYEVLPAALTLHDALSDDAPALHETMTTHFKSERFARGEDTGIKGNIAGHIQHKLGDVEKGFAEADVIVEREFETETVHQGYIEPHASTAVWSPKGRLTIWTCTQGAFGIRSETAAVLAIPESKVRVIPTEIGGGFGGKLTCYLEPVAAVLSRKSGRPVKIVMDRKEEFEGTGPTSATFMRCKMGATKSGKITAVELYMAFEAGAFPGSPVGAATQAATGAYNIENQLINGYDIVCNKQKVQAYRAPGQPQGTFAVEPVIDELAEKLGIDPMEVRLMNAAQEGDRMPTGVPLARIGIREMEEAMKVHPHYSAPLEKPNQGRGVAVGFRMQGGQSSSATINVNGNGTINLITGSVDIGGTRTAVAMQAAEVLGLNAEDVNPTVADTDAIGYTTPTWGSRTTFDTGLATIAAAEEVKRQMCARAALIWEVQPEEVELRDGVFANARNAEERMTFKELAGKLLGTGGPITCSASCPNATGLGPIIAGNIVDVQVDTETGKVDVLRCTTFLDAGTAVHPSYVEGQMQGGTVQGIGWALNEEYFYADDGAMLNSSFLDYRMPTSLDLPMIETVITEVPNPRHPYGLRGVGEAPIIPPLAALSNAIYDAVGVRLKRLPMTPGRVLEALEEERKAQR